MPLPVYCRLFLGLLLLGPLAACRRHTVAPPTVFKPSPSVPGQTAEPEDGTDVAGKKLRFQPDILQPQYITYPAHTFKSLTAKAKFTYADAKQKHSATASLRLAPDSLLWVSISPAMGIEAFRCLFRPDSVFFTDRLNKYYAAFSWPQLSRLMHLRVTFPFVQALLLNEPLLGSSSSDTLVNEGGEKGLRQTRGLLHATQFSDPATGAISRLFLLNSRTAEAFTLTNNDTDTLNGKPIPRRRFMEILYKPEEADAEPQKIDLSLHFTKITFSESSVPEFPYAVPAGYKKAGE